MGHPVRLLGFDADALRVHGIEVGADASWEAATGVEAGGREASEAFSWWRGGEVGGGEDGREEEGAFHGEPFVGRDGRRVQVASTKR